MALADRPNILLIVMDACRADHLSCYGYMRETSPQLDDLSHRGVLFEQAISPATWTLPSHTSLFTGTYLAAHGAHRGPYDGRFPTLAEALRRYGYQTAGFTNVGYVCPPFGLHRGFDHFVEIWRSQPKRDLTARIATKLQSIAEKFIPTSGRLDSDSGATETNRQAQEWLMEHRNEQRPFFAFINYADVHSPYRPPRLYRDMYLGEVMDWPGAEIPNRVQRVSDQPLEHISGRVSLGPQDLEILRALYDGGVRYLDAKIGELLGALEREKLLDQTLVIITSDHGDNLGEHGLVGHMLCLYDTLLHVPLIMYYPRHLPAGLRVSGQVQLVDLFPTVLDLIGIEDADLRASVQGKSLLPCLEGIQHRMHAVAEYDRPNILQVLDKEYPEFDYSAFDRELKAIRLDGFKYIWASDGRCELYNIVQDPGESQDLSGANPAKVEELHSKLWDWHEQHSSRVKRSGSVEVDVDAATVERLRSLGYID